MRRRTRSDQPLTPLELEIMNVLWETGAANVQAVQQRIKRDVAYTTVQTMLNILHRKNKVSRTLKDRAYFYKPIVSRRQVSSQIIGDIIDRLFGGSAVSLVMSMIETKHLAPEKLAQLNELLGQSQSTDEAEIEDDKES